MPRPTSATTVPRPVLSQLALEYMESQRDFIGLQVLPTFKVDQQNSDYPIIPLEALLNVPATQRAARAHYARGDWEFETDSFDCLENGWEEPVDETEAKLYARFFDAEEIAMQNAFKTILRVQEKRIADMLFNASNFTANAVTNEWDDATNATPIADVKAGRLAVRNACGLEPNVLIVSYSTFLDLGLCAKIVDRVKYIDSTIRAGDIPVSALEKLFGVDRVLVGSARYNSAKKGQSASLANVWSNEYAMLAVVNKNNNIKHPCVGRTFLWTADSPENVMVESYDEPQTRSTIIRARQHTDEEIMLIATAYLLSNITT